jgi:large subunit ribosomal protein L22
MPALEAEAQLKFRSQRAALPVLKLLKSGVASAIHNFNLSPENLYIFNIFVDEGQKLKRFRPRAFGRAGAIHKKTSHVTLVLEEKVPTAKKAKKKAVKKIIPKLSEAKEEKKEEAMEKPAAPKHEIPKEIRPAGKLSGFTKKIFRRKAIG